MIKTKVGAWASCIVATVLTAGLIAGWSVPAQAQAADDTASIEFVAESGAFPVNGRSGYWATPEQEVRVWEYLGVIKVDGWYNGGSDDLWIELSPPAGETLRPGTYPDVRHQGQDPAHGGILLISRGLGCGDDYATVTITKLARDDTGQLTALDASVIHHCSSPVAPAFSAHILLNA